MIIRSILRHMKKMQLILLYCFTRKNKTDTAEHEHKGKMLLEETEDKRSTISMKSCNK